MEGLTVVEIGKATVVEFYDVALMDASRMEPLAQQLYHLVDAEDRRWLVLDFARVQYVSSQFIGIVLSLHKKLQAVPKSRLVLCSVGPRLSELLRITRLDKVLTIKPGQREATRE